MTTVNYSVLDEAQVRKLRRCEKIVNEGLKRFIEVGAALQTIRDEKLWQGKYDSFKDYVDRRWALSPAHVTRLIQGSEVATRVAGIQNEAQARVLVNVPYTEQQTIVDRAVELARIRKIPLSAPLIREAARQPSQISARPELQSDEQPWEAEGLSDLWEMAQNLILDMKEVSRKLALHQQGCWLKGHMDTIEARLKDLSILIRFAKPHSPCPDCAGGIVANCETCKSRGWLPESRAGALKRKKTYKDIDNFETKD